MTIAVRRVVLLVVAAMTAACTGDAPRTSPTISIAGDDTVSTSTVEPTTIAAATTTISTMVPATDAEPEATPTHTPTTSVALDDTTVDFPPAGLPLLERSTLESGSDLLALRQVGPWLVAVEPPSNLVRIDPRDGTRRELELDVGESRFGPPELASAAGSFWAVGGPFRDQLIEIDLDEMRVLDRIALDDDHGLVGGEKALWLTTRRGVRPFDSVGRQVGDLIELPVDPAGGAVDDDGGVWIALPTAARVAHVTADGRVSLVDTEPGPQLVAASDGVVWLTHPPTIEISRIDAATETILSITDVDIAGNAATASTIRGFRLGHDDAWAFVRYDGSPYHPVLVRLDIGSGEISGARSVEFEGNTWTRSDDALWMHEGSTGALRRVDVEGFTNAPASELAVDDPPPTTVTEETDLPDRELHATFEQFLDPEVDATSIGVDRLADVRAQLIDLLTAQEGGGVRVVSIERTGDRATVVFDVVVAGDTVILPMLRFDYVRSGDDRWIPTDESICEIASGVGVDCSPDGNDAGG